MAGNERFISTVLDYYRYLACRTTPIVAERIREFAIGIVAVKENTCREINLLFDGNLWWYTDPALGLGTSTETLKRFGIDSLPGSRGQPPPQDFFEAMDFARSMLRPAMGRRLLYSPWIVPPKIIRPDKQG